MVADVSSSKVLGNNATKLTALARVTSDWIFCHGLVAQSLTRRGDNDRKAHLTSDLSTIGNPPKRLISTRFLCTVLNVSAVLVPAIWAAGAYSACLSPVSVLIWARTCTRGPFASPDRRQGRQRRHGRDHVCGDAFDPGRTELQSGDILNGELSTNARSSGSHYTSCGAASGGRGSGAVF